jgi:hypothetical protein
MFTYGKLNRPKSKKSCSKRNMSWVASHKSKDANGKKIKVKGSCRKRNNKKSKSKSNKYSGVMGQNSRRAVKIFNY